jgi:sulfonate transport system permease protein
MTPTDTVASARPHPVRAANVERITIEPEKSKRTGWRPRRSVRRTFGPLTFLLAWYLSSASGLLPEDVLASPVDVVRQAIDLTADGELPDAIVTSGQRALGGFALGGLTALALALVAGLFRLGEDLIDATVGMIRTVPWVGLIPLFIIWFGIDEAPKIALVALAVGFPLYFNLYGGIRSVDTQLIETAKVLGLGRAGLIRHVILPGAVPGALVGLRYALGSAWLALVFGETVNATAGIGYLMNNAREFFQTDVIVVCLVVYAILGLICDFIVRLLGKYLLSWRSSFDGT